MTEVKKLSPVTLEEFEAIEKEEQFNYELIDGVVMMSPSPSREHQKVASNLHFRLRIQLKNTNCEALFELDINHCGNIYKPDLMIFCNGNEELPDIIFEILSPSTRRYDLVIKLIKYEEMGIKEYWIVDPKTKTITVHDFVNATAESYSMGETIQCLVHPEITIAVTDIFA